MSVLPKCWAIIPAAGIGQRMASSTPKQYLKIGNKTILEHAANTLLNDARITQVVFALHEKDSYFSQLTLDHAHKIRSVIGGDTRAHSVLNAMHAIQAEINADDFVLVHDAARPCLQNADLDKLIDVCLNHEVGGILAAPVTDTIKRVRGNEIDSTLVRTHLWRAFTPQMFKFKLLYDALTKALSNNVLVTDEASAMEYMQHRPCVVEGSTHNIKVTSPDDLIMAESYLTSK